MESTIDETIDLALTLLEDGTDFQTEKLATWIMDNLVHVLDEYQTGPLSRCMVAGYDVCRVGDKVIATTTKSEVMDSEEARMLAAALLRAAEAADQEL